MKLRNRIKVKRGWVRILIALIRVSLSCFLATFSLTPSAHILTGHGLCNGWAQLRNRVGCLAWNIGCYEHVLRVTQLFGAQTNEQIYFRFFFLLHNHSIRVHRTLNNGFMFHFRQIDKLWRFGTECGSCDVLIGSNNARAWYKPFPPTRDLLLCVCIDQIKHAIVSPQNSQTLHSRLSNSKCLI